MGSDDSPAYRDVPVAGVTTRTRHVRQSAGWWLVSGAVLYLAAFAITAAHHVPHNDALAQVDATGPGAAAAWHEYAAAWTRLNHVRAAAALAASASYMVALVRLHPCAARGGTRPLRPEPPRRRAAASGAGVAARRR